MADLLMSHLAPLKSLVDEHQFWATSGRAYDTAHLRSLACEHPGFVRVIFAEGRRSRPLYGNCTESGTVYVLLDGICWMRPEALESLIDFRIDYPQYFLVLPAAVNTGRTMYIHQVMGRVPENVLPRWAGEYIDHLDLSEESPSVGPLLHGLLCDAIEAGEDGRWRFGRYESPDYEVMPAMGAWLGESMAQFGHSVTGSMQIHSEKRWLSEVAPKTAGARNCIWGQSLMAYCGPDSAAPAMAGVMARYREIALKRVKENRDDDTGE
jgi:hypothetical protein